jgi:hypothetical protein
MTLVAPEFQVRLEMASQIALQGVPVDLRRHDQTPGSTIARILAFELERETRRRSGFFGGERDRHRISERPTVESRREEIR